MDAFLHMLDLQAVLLIYLAGGFLCHALGIVTEDNQRKFTDFVLTILMPCMVFQSFKSVTPELLGSAAQALGVSLVICLVSWALGNALWRRMEPDRRDVARYATLIDNAGFAGLPLASQAFGEAGLLYASAYLIPIRVFMWSAGVTMLSGEHASPAEIARKLATNPNIVAIVLGLVRGLAGVPLPDFLDRALDEVGACVSPCSMIVIGAIAAQVDPRTLLEHDVVAYLPVRLLLIPLVAFVIVHAAGMPYELAGTCMLEAGMPAASTTALLASTYGRDAAYGSKLICASTVCSLVTVPLLMLLV